jgi:hypothetical protein
MKRHRVARDTEIEPQEDLHLLLPHAEFPRAEVYPILERFGGLKVERENINRFSSVPILEEAYTIFLKTPSGVEDSADGSLVRIPDDFRPSYAPEACWDVGLCAHRGFLSRWLTHAVAYNALVLIPGCVLFRPTDAKVVADADQWYAYLERSFWSQEFVALGLAAEDGRLLI